MTSKRIAVFVALGLLSTTAAMAEPNGVMNRDSNVRQTSSNSSPTINYVEEDQEVLVLSCTSNRCKIKIPGPDGWVRKSYIDLYDEEEEADPAPPPAPDLPYGPDTCKNGYVWRDAIPGDHVCVVPDSRSTAANVSTGPPNSTSTRGLFFSAITRASASPDENRTKLTLMPLAFSNSSNIGRAQFSGQIE